MGCKKYNEKTPLKLSYPSLPNQSPEPPGTVTHPFRTSASVPFDWEEAPGKPRTYVDSTTTLPSRSLGLPPRLAKITQTPLDGPNQVPRGSKGSDNEGKKGFGALRCGSVRERREEWRGIFDFSYSVGSGYGSEGESSRVRFGKFRRRSFFGSSGSRTWARIYDNVKQVVDWRRKQ